MGAHMPNPSPKLGGILPTVDRVHLGHLLKLPNIISLCRIGMVPIFLVLLSKDRFTAALYVFVLAAVTDALDGAVARWFDIRTELGAILDPFADKLMLLSALVVLTFVQLYLGALVAGLRAGLVYNTWPDIDGSLVPSATRLWFETPWWRNLFDNTLTVQFEHRMTAYALLALAALHAIDAVRSRAGTAAVNGALWLLAAITLQATLGILTLLNQVPIGLALTHQAAAIAVLTLAVLQAERLAARQADSARQELAAPVGQPG